MSQASAIPSPRDPAPPIAANVRYKSRSQRKMIDMGFVAVCVTSASLSIIILLYLLASIARQALGVNFETNSFKNVLFSSAFSLTLISLIVLMIAGFGLLFGKRSRSRLITVAVAATLLVLGLLATVSIVKGESTYIYLTKTFLTEPHSYKPRNAGMYPAIIGSVFVCAVCAATAIPIGVGTAILLEEFKPKNNKLRRVQSFVQLNITNLAGVPSIVYGTLGLTAFVYMFGLFGTVNEPLLEIGSSKSGFYFRLPFGRGVLAAGLTLMLVVQPIIIVASQEALRAVPDSLRQGALALGATRWQTVWNITLPASIPGIMTGSILAMSRAIGEAAPILVVSAIGYIALPPQNLMGKFTVMPLQIFNWASEAKHEYHNVAAAGIVVLLAELLTFNAVAVFVRQKFTKQLS